MPIDADLILRQALEIHRLSLDPQRAAELADEVNALIDNAIVASEEAVFDDDPGYFSYLLSEFRDPLLG